LVDGDPSVLRVGGTNITSSPEGFTEIEGKLTAQQNDVRASADRGTYDQKNRLLTLEGNIQLRQSGLLMVGESAAVHQDTGTSELANASIKLKRRSKDGVIGNA
jgi:lipopolysaccharide assembly outer membrane protein LptD (OstA)